MALLLQLHYYCNWITCIANILRVKRKWNLAGWNNYLIEKEVKGANFLSVFHFHLSWCLLHSQMGWSLRSTEKKPDLSGYLHIFQQTTKSHALISIYWFILYMFLPVDTFHSVFNTYVILYAKTSLQNDFYIFIFSIKYI